MRLFVALPIPTGVRDRLAAAVATVRDQAPGLRWTDPAGWHVTLAFLGSVPDERLGDVVEAVRSGVDAAGCPDTLSLGAAGRFGRRVLWVGVTDHPDGSLSRAGDAIQEALARRGLPVDRRAVRGHLTLARAGKGQVGQGQVDGIATPDAAWPCRAVEVWSSTLRRGGARYACVASVAGGG